MKLEGRVWKDDKWWLIEVPVLGAMTQGRTRKDAFDMMADWVRNAVRDPTCDVTFSGASRSEHFTMSSSQDGRMLALLLRRHRESQGLSLAQAAERLGVKSKNAYARYERGDTEPTLGKLRELIKAVRPGADVVISIC